MTEKQAIKKTIAHWERMIKWAKKQNHYNFVNKNEMMNEIGECWDSRYCDLCIKYNKNRCAKCPLKRKYGGCIMRTDNLWFSVATSRIWDEWIDNAKDFLKQLKSLEV